MDRLCPLCRKITTDDRLVRCPECYSLFNTFTSPPYPLTQEQEDRIYQRIHRRLKQYVFGSFSILTLISFVVGLDSYLSIYQRATRTLNSLMVSRVSQEFKEPRIKAIVQEVASDQAKALLNDEIKPQVTDFQKETKRSIEDFERITQAMAAQYTAEYDRLNQKMAAVQVQSDRVSASANGLSTSVLDLQQRSKQYEVLNQSVTDTLADLKRREEFNDLSGKATAQGDRLAYQQLVDIAKAEKNESLKQTALSEIARVKQFWASGITRTQGAKLTKNGKEIQASDVETCELMTDVRTVTTAWIVRCLGVVRK